MKLSQQWLQDFLTIDLDAETLSNTLTSAGLEVAAVEPVAHEFSQVVIGQIKTIGPHPDADKLRLCTVDIGQAEPLSIVCGADNIYISMKIPVADPSNLQRPLITPTLFPSTSYHRRAVREVCFF